MVLASGWMLGGGLFAERAACQQAGDFRPALQVINEGSWAAGLRAPGSRLTDQLIVQPSLRYRSGDQKWRLSASLAGQVLAGQETKARLRVREAYLGAEVGDFGFVAGKRILRWGVGYAFTSTGVLDPPRAPTDPADRLSLNEGRGMAQLDWIRGAHAVTAVWAGAGVVQKHRPGMRETVAMRYNTLVSGFDLSLIASQDRGRRRFIGGNFTRVIGDAYELHGEFARRDRSSFLIGGKYT